MTSSICGGQHSNIKTKEDWLNHIRNTDPLTCLDCMAGIGFTDKYGKYWSIE